MTILKKAVVASALLLAIAVSAPASADTFTLTNNNGGDGFATFPPGVDVDLFGADNGVGANLTTYTATAPTNETFSLNWKYHTDDLDPSFDPAGYILNGILTQLSLDTGPHDQFGSFVISVLAGQVYGLYVDSTDSRFGRANISVSETPLPATLPMFLGGAGLIGLLARRRKQKQAA